METKSYLCKLERIEDLGDGRKAFYTKDLMTDEDLILIGEKGITKVDPKKIRDGMCTLECVGTYIKHIWYFEA